MNEWDGHASEWDNDPYARAYSRAAYDSLGCVLSERGIDVVGATVLDFGCGTGLLTEQLADRCSSIVAVDTSRAMLDVLHRKATERKWSLVETSVELPTTPGVFDLIACSSVCAFLDDYPGTAKQLGSLLRPGGVFVQWDWERDDAHAEPHGLSLAEVATALESAGLVDVVVTTGFSVEDGDVLMEPLMGVGQRPSITP